MAYRFNPFTNNLDDVGDGSPSAGDITTINNVGPDGAGNFSITSSSGTITITNIPNGQNIEVTNPAPEDGVVFLQTSSYVVLPGDRIIVFLASPPITLTIPFANTNIGRCITVKAISSSHPISISNGADSIAGDGAFTGTYVLDTDGGAIDLWAVEPSTTSPTGTGIWVTA